MKDNNDKKFSKGMRLSPLQKVFLAAFPMSLATAVSAEQQEVWLENFNDTALNNKGALFNTIDMENVTKWSIDVSNANLENEFDWFKVTNQQFEGRDIGGDSAWMSEQISISDLTNVSFSLKVSESGTHEPSDYVDIFYSLDGGDFVRVDNWQEQGNSEHTLIDDFSAVTVSVAVPSANTLQLKVVMANSSGSEYTRIDDVSVVAGEQSGGGEEPDPIDPMPVGPDLFFSEYVEGSGFNKAVEIYNPTDDAISLSGYQFKLYSNGSSQPTSVANLSGEVLAGDVIVIGGSQISSDSDLLNYVDVQESAINFNGDDYFELVKQDQVIDSFGQRGVRESWGANKTLVRKPEVTQGDNVVDNAFNPDDQWLEYDSNTFTFLGSHNSSGGGDGGEPPEPIDFGQCGDQATLISAIQGAGDASAVVNQTHIVEAVVTNVLPDLQGFILQEELADNDADTQSSEALFVFLNNRVNLPTLGNKVRVQGNVSEFFDRTQLSLSAELLDCGQGEAIAPQEITLPVTGSAQLESLENMLVTLPQSLSVTNTFNLTRFGQFEVSNGRLFNPTNIYPAGSPQAQALAERNSRNTLFVDDKKSSQNPDVVPYPSPALSYNTPIRLGDKVANLQGTLDFSFGNYQLLPTLAPVFTAANPRSEEVISAAADELKIASFNVLNYFNGNGDGTGFPTPRGADNEQEFDRQQSKIIAALAQIDADVVGLMEIENDGFGDNSAIAQLVRELNASVGANTYDFVALPGAGIGSDAIAVGMIYKPSKVSPVGNAATISTTPFDFRNRQPLAQTFATNVGGNGEERFTIAVNHFKSKGGCGSATGANQDQNDGQGCWNLLRTQAATGLVNWLATNPTGIDEDDVLIVGDLNAYGKEDPINAITASGYTNLLAAKIGPSAYTYSFGGEMGYLDHALASGSLAAQVQQVQAWHINADEPRAFDYNLEFKTSEQQTSFYAPTAFRASDHDPVIVTVRLGGAEQSLVGDFDGDQDVDINDIRALLTAIRANNIDLATQDINQDGTVNFSDIRAMYGLCSRNRCRAE
ncbi:DNA degradation protein EddB [Thalassotalea euphylliae]|uniref:DNA degradation protein EddB n=2 Tax=Thalassotalea euphylliae TaxID=1655234 RepID=A0A3E0TRG5_9GAMM|nr:DNA degradation protein EddB [Thalassotalea euphylliae]